MFLKCQAGLINVNQIVSIGEKSSLIPESKDGSRIVSLSDGRHVSLTAQEHARVEDALNERYQIFDLNAKGNE